MKTLNEVQETQAKADTGTTFFTHLPVFNYFFILFSRIHFFEQNTHFNSLNITWIGKGHLNVFVILEVKYAEYKCRRECT